MINATNLKINKITIDDEKYPEKLRTIHSPPKVLYYMGEIPDFNMPCISIVGARMCTPYGMHIASELGKILARENICVISGMAKGIDGISQEAALDNNGLSVGVLGCGVNVCYPAANKNLYNKLIEKGCIISEYPPATKPMASLFPPRNRIISALCDALVVIEAKEKSGTLITTDYALEQGKDIYIVPGRITDETSKGCLSLINQGAYVITDISEFVKTFTERFFYKNYMYKNRLSVSRRSKRSSKSINNKSNKKTATSKKEIAVKNPNLSETENKLYNSLDYTPNTIDQLAKITDLNINTIKNDIITLELFGLTKEISKGYYIKV